MSLTIRITKPGKPLPDRPTPKGIERREQRKRQAEFHRRVVARDGGKCVMCGRRLNDLTDVYPDLRMLIADHIVPKILDGGDEVRNGQTLCFFHNLSFGWQARVAEKGGGEQGGVDSES